MDTISRLKQFIDFVRLTSTQFADKADIPRPSLSQILTGRNKKISTDLVQKLHVAFPELNILWLLYGEGSMTVSGVEVKQDAAPLLDFETQKPEESVTPPTPTVHPTLASATEKCPADKPAIAIQAGKTVDYIMVFYTDQTFDMFKKVQ